MISRSYLQLLALPLLLPPPLALGAPGGYIVHSAMNSWWLRPLLILLLILLVPLGLWYAYSTRRSIKACRSVLHQLAKHHPAFHILSIEQRVQECFLRIFAAWDEGDVAEASAWMTPWYWQNQQLAVLDRWRRKGLKNVTSIRGSLRIRPIYVSIAEQAPDWEGSRLSVLIEGEIEDYLLHTSSGKIVEGQKGFVDYASIWTFELHKKQWLVSQIAPEEALRDYLALPLELPRKLPEPLAAHQESL